MTMKLELSDEKLLEELMGVLTRHGCHADQANHPGVRAVLSG
jgi:hypothetical protein